MKKAFCVAIYETNRAYGGPEEGGWWFDCGVPSTDPELMKYTKVFCCEVNESDSLFPDEVREYRRKLIEIAEEENKKESRYPTGSVLCNGYLSADITEGSYPKPYPSEVPHYE